MSFSSEIKHEILSAELSACCKTARLHGMSLFGKNKPSLLTIDQAILQFDCCHAAFLSGVMLTCGNVSDPASGYHMEFETPYKSLSDNLVVFLTDLGYPPKATMRNSRRVVYYKDSTAIEDLLGLMGAQQSLLELMNVKILRDVRNNANRAANCDHANINKTIQAARAQRTCIERLIAANRFDNLPEELQELAQARLEHPEHTLAELAALLHLSKSGAANRMKKLMEIGR